MSDILQWLWIHLIQTLEMYTQYILISEINNVFKYRVFLCVTVYHTETEGTLQHLQHAMIDTFR